MQKAEQLPTWDNGQLLVEYPEIARRSTLGLSAARLLRLLSHIEGWGVFGVVYKSS